MSVSIASEAEDRFYFVPVLNGMNSLFLLFVNGMHTPGARMTALIGVMPETVDPSPPHPDLGRDASLAPFGAGAVESVPTSKRPNISAKDQA
jgi:hypothetical protein